ncbi:hypothetical protein IC235_11270 [Hymenobacter sp. BT664]|uniref:KAP NTPase domain-containing protein n=1 Tax=Hymenobacter montanus TaxID=2771359 RepID=A0A927BCV7_9BACT|nr:P-loop NTPase fold protein [Hymenobacter montanus]MBD2768470.1 hypothetical protein [Hymenobacter montanus]
MSIQISIKHQSALFKEHFEEENNDRIIFSGAFGIGKTYFLDKFFAPTNSEYLAVKLAPVNYSVSANEDIFKLIKYDVLFELLLHHGLELDTDPVVINRSVAYGVAMPGKAQSIAEGFMKVLPLLNKSAEGIPTIVGALYGWLTTIQELEKERNMPGVDSEVEKAAEEIAKHFTLEADHITAFLEESITRLATEKQAKVKVLIIDDLDRIDPEHIFRLFNIFSAHLDYHKTNRNKFGFDKVLFVCDIKNIKNIFLTRYGADTDFSGYIDKFYSKEVYFFNNAAEVRKAVDKIVQAVQFNEESKHYYEEHILRGDRGNGRSLLEVVLTELVHAEALMVRRIMTGYNVRSRLNAGSLGLSSPSAHEVRDWQIPAAVSLKILHKILGGSEPMEKALRRTMQHERSEEYKTFAEIHQDWLIGLMLPILGYEQHQFTHDLNAAFNYRNPHNEQSVQYNLYKYGSGRNLYYGNLISLNGNNVMAPTIVFKIDFFGLLHQAFGILQKTGYLR